MRMLLRLFHIYSTMYGFFHNLHLINAYIQTFENDHSLHVLSPMPQYL